MAKHIDSELLAILRKFEIAGELSSKKRFAISKNTRHVLSAG